MEKLAMIVCGAVLMVVIPLHAAEHVFKPANAHTSEQAAPVHAKALVQ